MGRAVLFLDYAQSKEWLESLGQKMKGHRLAPMRKLAEHSRLDLAKLRAVHVAGSNGKGSTCAFISRILREQGYRTGLYTSPHLVEPVERIQVNGRPIPKGRFAKLASYFRGLCTRHGLAASYFEVVTAMALRHFLDEGVDYAVIEVGMGGRLDATNVVNPVACAITSISLEHTQYLGNTIGKIAGEKAGIVKHGVPVVAGANNAGLKVIRKMASEAGSRVVLARWRVREISGRGETFDLVEPARVRGLRTSMLGEHQCENASLAVAMAVALREEGVEISGKSVRDGIKKAFWGGRLETLLKRPLVVVDAAHNPDGWEKLRKSLPLFRRGRLVIVFGAMKDKDIAAAKRLLSKASEVLLTKSSAERAAEPEEIMEKAGMGIAVVPLEAAVQAALTDAGKEGTVLVAGSVYLVGEFCGAWRKTGFSKAR